MSTLHQAGRALQAGFGFALLAALALVNGCASGEPAGESGQFGDPPRGEAADAFAIPTPQAIYTCRFGLTELGALRLFSGIPPEHPTCSISNLEVPDASRVYCTPLCPECRDLSTSLGCFLVP